MKIILFISIAFILIACSSHKKTAIKLTEKGLYEDALIEWEKAYEEDPKDDDVKLGLQDCQEKVVNDRLVKIRDERLAGKEESALNRLLELVLFQSKSRVKTDFNSSTFQGKETVALWQHEKRKIRELVEIMKPLGAEVRHRKFNPVFHSMAEAASYQTAIMEQGKKQCSSIRKDMGGKPFYDSFVHQFCGFFDPGRKMSSTIAAELFARSESKINVEHVRPELQNAMKSDMDQAFTEGPWFDRDSNKTISLQVIGEYQVKVVTEEIQQAHNYIVKVPYTEYVGKPKTRQVPYQVREKRCGMSSAGKKCHDITMTKFREEKYSDQQAVTKYRDDPRVYRYEATKKTQHLSLLLSGETILGSLKMPFTYSKTENENKITHDISMPKIGLNPATEDVSHPMTKFSEFSKAAAAQFKLQLNDFWKVQFCVLPIKRDFANMGNQVVKCKRADDYPVEFVDRWFITHFGSTAKEAEVVLGKF